MTTERQHYLDGMRAIAIAGVVLVHSSKMFGSVPHLTANASEYGAKGVQLFFIVSGFTLGLRYLNRPLDIQDFYIRRFFRIAPMFYLAAIFYAALGACADAEFAVYSHTVLTVLLTATFLHGWLPETINHSVPGGWSIGAEAMFYATFPALYAVFMMAKTNVVRMIIVLAAFVIGADSFVWLNKYMGAVGKQTNFPYYFWLTQLPAFVLGMALSQMRGLLPKALAAPVFYATLGAIVVAAVFKSSLSNFFVADILFGSLMLSASVARPRLIENRVASYIGEVSFSVYIVHFAVADLVGWVFPALNTAQGSVTQLAAVFFFVLVVSIAISALTYRFIEQPMIAVGRRLANARKASRPLVA